MQCHVLSSATPAFIIPSGSDIGLYGCGIGNIFKSIILSKFNLIKGLRSNCSAPYQGIGLVKTEEQAQELENVSLLRL